jgi:hypothetical protein
VDQQRPAPTADKPEHRRLRHESSDVKDFQNTSSTIRGRQTTREKRAKKRRSKPAEACICWNEEHILEDPLSNTHNSARSENFGNFQMKIEEEEDYADVR